MFLICQENFKEMSGIFGFVKLLVNLNLMLILIWYVYDC